MALMVLSVSFRFITKGYLCLTDREYLIVNYSKNIGYAGGPAMVYLYFKNLVFPKKKFPYKELIHFIFPIILFIENKYTFIENLIQIELKGIITMLIVAQFIYYSTIIFSMLRKRIWKKTSLMEMETKQAALLKKWTYVLFSTFLLMGLRLMFSLIFLQNKEFIYDIYFIWINSLAWFVIFMMIFTSPSILMGYESKILIVSKAAVSQTKRSNYWRINPINQITSAQEIQLSRKIEKQLETYFLKIDDNIEKEGYFQLPGFTIDDLAYKLSIPKSHLIFLFKYHSAISFSDYKKVVRIKKALELIEDGYLKTNTFDSLSKEVGFSTYNTFYTAFKEVTSQAPQEYVTDLS
jgi:AraC-like DNA-binding protein